MRIVVRASLLAALVFFAGTCAENDPPVAPDEMISTPQRPSGPRVTEISESETYTATGGMSNLGHEIAYQFDWGDGEMSQWGPPVGTHAWSIDASYGVRVRARCIEHPARRSAWSAASLPISVQTPDEIVVPPARPEGPIYLDIDRLAAYTTTGAESNLGHPVQYRFDWGDGTRSSWLDYPVAAHSWHVIGSVPVSAFARCALDPEIISVASDTLTVDLTTEEQISQPYTPLGSLGVLVLQPNVYITGAAVSNLGHRVEYRFDWGDGQRSGWVTDGIASHTWSAAGVFGVTAQARCTVDTIVRSPVTDTLEVTASLSEYVTRPDRPTGEVLVNLFDNVEYTTGGAVNNLGHPVEYQFSWGDGTFSTWVTDPSMKHKWLSTGSRNVFVTARCTTHRTVRSDPSEVLVVQVLP